MAATDAAPQARERSIGELFGELAGETSTLVRQEMKLATTELAHKATFAARSAAVVMGGALLGVVSMLTLAAAAVLLLGRVVPLWAAALIVAGVLAVIAYAVARTGLSALKNMEVRPTETIASLQENKSWAKQQIQ